jgi:hypothetical protein
LGAGRAVNPVYELGPTSRLRLGNERSGAPRRIEAQHPGFGILRAKDQLKMLVFKSLEQMLNAGGNVEEIRRQLKEEADNVFKKGLDMD